MSAIGAGAGPGPAANPCQIPKNQKGHSLVIVYHVDARGEHTFFFGQESSYVDYVRADGKKTGFRPLAIPAGIDPTDEKALYAEAKKDPVFTATRTRKVVLRPDPNKPEMKYTIQEPSGIWGFPKGGAKDASETSKETAAREFFEEVGHKLNKKNLIFKRCIQLPRRDTSAIFHYKVNDKEKQDILDAYKQKSLEREGELFSAKFFTRRGIETQRKNALSEKAFESFDEDEVAIVNQRIIPKASPVSSRKTKSASARKRSSAKAATQKLKKTMTP